MKFSALIFSLFAVAFVAGDAVSQQGGAGRLVCAPTASEQTTVEAIAAEPRSGSGGA